MTARRRRHGARFPRRLFPRTLAALLALAATVLAGPAAAQPSDGQTFKDWRLRCGKADAATPPPCHIFQTVVVSQTGQPFLYVAAGYPPEGTGGPTLFLTLPLGIHLPSGVRLSVDQGQPVPVPVVHCDRDGCHARLALDRRLIESLRAGLVAQVGFQDGVGQPITVPVSLKGFTAALKAVR